MARFKNLILTFLFAVSTVPPVLASTASARILDLTDLDGTNGFKVLGDPDSGNLGASLSTAGDLNGMASMISSS